MEWLVHVTGLFLKAGTVKGIFVWNNSQRLEVGDV
jgi:hypothetical protein